MFLPKTPDAQTVLSPRLTLRMVMVTMSSTKMTLPLLLVVPLLASGSWDPGKRDRVCLTPAALNSIPDVHKIAMTVLFRGGGLSLTKCISQCLDEGSIFRSLSGDRVRGFVGGSYTIYSYQPSHFLGSLLLHDAKEMQASQLLLVYGLYQVS